MTDLSGFPITKRWPALHPDRIQLYSLPTPNGIKVSAALEELGLAYEPHLVSFGTDDQMTPEFLSLNPNNKIPAILDPDGPGGQPLPLWESGAILIYLADKTGKLMPTEPAARYEALQWLMFQMGGVGPMFGQFGHFFKFAADTCDHPYPTERYTNEARRLLGVLDKRLEDRETVLDYGYSVVDLAIWPWVRVLGGFYGAGDHLGLSDFPNVMRWLEACEARPASQVGINTPSRD
ncbi:MAG: glutathione S-transferase N-terminal domain-containing protein [Pseudomonadota bacterium]